MQQIEPVEIVVKELWTAKQRQMNPVHYTVSYRGSFKPELPAFFIEKFLPKDFSFKTLFLYSKEKESKIPIIFDPFAGRGTTVIQANIMGCFSWANDINPMFERIVYPLTHLVSLDEMKKRLDEINWTELKIKSLSSDEKLKLRPFYHPKTLNQIINLKEHLRDNREDVDRCIEIVALSRLHGHSSGFFSAYSFPQISVLPKRQKMINEKHGKPKPKNIAELILRKYRRSISGNSMELQRLKYFGFDNRITNYDSTKLPKKDYPNESVDLIITSPPFLAQVDYIADNWLEFWFLNINAEEFRDKLIQTPNLDKWKLFIQKSLLEMYRVLKSNSKCVIEVGDVSYNGKRVNLDEIVKDIGIDAGFKLHKRYINEQQFTKLSNCFKVENNKKGVNSNRMVVYEKS